MPIMMYLEGLFSLAGILCLSLCWFGGASPRRKGMATERKESVEREGEDEIIDGE